MVNPIAEEQSVAQFNILCEMAAKNGFEHYEVSNLCKPKYESKHNSAYWEGVPYLGLGPSAHSYNSDSRCWNPASISAWAEAIEKEISPVETEVLTEKDMLNEYLMVSLRTAWGIDCYEIEKKFGIDHLNRINEIAKKYIETSSMLIEGSRISINPSHFFVSDSIILDFII
jgi:oxygen-independent coproporphyrinogen-3 oxidase